MKRLAISAVLLTLLPGLQGLRASEPVAGSIDAIRAVGPMGAGHAAAVAASKKLAAADATQLTAILAGMDGANNLATNWLRTAVDTVAARSLEQSGKLPVAELEEFLADTDHAPRARRLAYEWIVKVDPQAPDRLMPKMLDDPSLELRRDAVQRELDAAAMLSGDAAATAYLKILRSVRDLDQVKICTDALAKLERPVDVAAQLGFITEWRLIAPFDNVGQKGYAVAYPPEQEIKLDAAYDGKNGEIKWFAHKTADPYGAVDLAELLNKEKGAIAYALAEFTVTEPRDVQLRLGCINANKVWCNGELVSANEIYHANTKVDQYIAPAKLKAGKNHILVKICQNEQTEQWAQGFKFQLRVTDALGGAVLSTDRSPGKTAALPSDKK